MMSPETLVIISRYQLAFVALAGVATLLVWPEAAVGTVAGGAVMAANFWIMQRALLRLIDGGTSQRTKLLYGLFLVGKFFLVMGALAVLVLVLELHPLGIALGMMSLFAGIGLGVAHRTLRGATAS